jgi:predicted ATPase
LNAVIYELSQDGITEVEYEKTEHFWLTRDFLLNRQRFLRNLIDDGSEP